MGKKRSVVCGLGTTRSQHWGQWIVGTAREQGWRQSPEAGQGGAKIKIAFLPIGVLVLVLSLGLFSSLPDAEAHGKGRVPQETFQIMELQDADNVPDSALGAIRLNRTRDEIWASVHVSGLAADAAYTIWVVIFNNPGACVTNPGGDVRCGLDDLLAVPNPARSSAFNVGAFVTGSDGNTNSSVHIRSGAPPDGAFVIPLNGVRPGLRQGNGFGAEVHLVIRAHGDILTDAITNQLSMLDGGCLPPNTNTCVDVRIATFPRVTD